MYDMKKISKLNEIKKYAPEAVDSFKAFTDAALKDGEIPAKYKELIAISVALTTQCPYCIEDHSQRARKAGATETELAEVTMVAAAMRAGAGVAHGLHLF